MRFLLDGVLGEERVKNFLVTIRAGENGVLGLKEVCLWIGAEDWESARLIELVVALAENLRELVPMTIHYVSVRWRVVDVDQQAMGKWHDVKLRDCQFRPDEE